MTRTQYMGKGVIEISISNILDLFVISRISNNCETMFSMYLFADREDRIPAAPPGAESL